MGCFVYREINLVPRYSKTRCIYQCLISSSNFQVVCLYVQSQGRNVKTFELISLGTWRLKLFWLAILFVMCWYLFIYDQFDIYLLYIVESPLSSFQTLCLYVQSEGRNVQTFEWHCSVCCLELIPVGSVASNNNCSFPLIFRVYYLHLQYSVYNLEVDAI